MRAEWCDSGWPSGWMYHKHVWFCNGRSAYGSGAAVRPGIRSARLSDPGGGRDRHAVEISAYRDGSHPPVISPPRVSIAEHITCRTYSYKSIRQL